VVTKVVWGATHVTKPNFDIGVEKCLSEYFEKYHTIQLDNFKISNDEMLEDGRSKIVTHTKRSIN
jgi:formylmethanofuran dehydrogenase subunit A